MLSLTTTLVAHLCVEDMFMYSVGSGVNGIVCAGILLGNCLR